jgi:hypothetical protein
MRHFLKRPRIILIDLSDRIDNKQDVRQSVQADRDISIINILSAAIRKNVAAHGSFKSKARFNIYFHPEPAEKEIRDIAGKLSAAWVSSNDMTTAKQNKITYQALEDNFAKGLNDIYSLQATGQYQVRYLEIHERQAKIKCIEQIPAIEIY